MRLLNTKTLKFQEFFDWKIPEYAILSHCWGDDEVSYEKFLATAENDRVGTGWEKILKFCEIAGTDGIQFKHYRLGHGLHTFDWVWIDTCCIDKRSSAELSEAINSMYNWYGLAKVCLVFLPDVHEVSEQDLETMADLQQNEVYATYSADQMRSSRWFTRGWTLQELVAPQKVAFYNTAYQILGWKHHKTMLRTLNETTRIDQSILLDPYEARHVAIAVRFSWASMRQTSRAEDMSYCLLGLCEVNLPLLYGEGGGRAFQRLQLEIISKSSDDSIFAFDTNSPHGAYFLANSPAKFANCGDLRASDSWKRNTGRLYTRTQRGIEFDTRIPRGIRLGRGYHHILVRLLDSLDSEPSTMYLVLACSKGIDGNFKDFEWIRKGVFEWHRTLGTEADLWKRTFGWESYSRASAKDVLTRKYLDQLKDESSSLELPPRDKFRWLWYMLYPAKTIHVNVPL